MEAFHTPAPGLGIVLEIPCSWGLVAQWPKPCRIKDNLKNKVCIELDVDRQKITTFGTPKDIDRLIREEVSTLGSREGGLMMVFGLYPGTPLENVKALMDAMEKYAFYFN